MTTIPKGIVYMQCKHLLIIAIVLTVVSCHKKTEQQGAEHPLIFLHYWSDDLGSGIDTMMQAISSMNKKIHIKSTGFDHESFKISIKVMLAGGNPPDLFSYWAGARTEALVNASYLEPITDVWQSNSMDTMFSPMIQKACKYKGSYYVMPINQHYVAFFYNKKLFNKYGIVPPKTWEEFNAVCDKFIEEGVTPIELGARDRWPAQFWFDYILLRTAGPGFRDSLMNGTAKYNDQRVLSTFSIWKKIIDKRYFMPNSDTKDWAESAKAVALGETPMILMGTWIIGMFDNQYNLKQGIDYDFFSFPSISEDVPSVAIGPIDGIVLPKASNITQSKKVITSFTLPDVQRAMSVGSGALSPSLILVPSDDSPVQQRIHKELQTINHWAFNYDLAAQPEIAELGLTLFSNFLKRPDSYAGLLAHMQQILDSTSLK